MRALHKFGRNPNVGSFAIETVWEVGGLYPWPERAERLELVSDSNRDRENGRGARYVQISGLNRRYEEIQETVTMDGTNPTSTQQRFFRLQRVQVLDAGRTRVNEGTIITRGRRTGDVLSQVTAGLGQSQLGIFTVPAG